MFGNVYSTDFIRSYIILFGSLFADIVIEHDGVPYTVPLTYSPKEKMLARLMAEPDMDRPVALTVPRIGYQMTGWSIDAGRRLNSVQTRFCDEEGNQYTAPVPLNINFELTILVRNVQDGHKILEQILPYFNPDITLRLKSGPINYGIPIIIDGVSGEDTYVGPVEVNRLVQWTLTFTMRAWLPGLPLSAFRDDKYITQIEVTFKHRNGKDSMVRIRPGLTADGQPTSDPTLTIDRNNIKPDDNYGFIQEIFE